MGEPVDGLCQLVSKHTLSLPSQPLILYSADYMQGTRVSFRSKEDAIHFAEKQGKSFGLKHLYLAHAPIRMGLFRVCRMEMCTRY